MNLLKKKRFIKINPKQIQYQYTILYTILYIFYQIVPKFFAKLE